MRLKRTISCMLLAGAILLTGCASSEGQETTAAETSENVGLETQLEKIDMTQWQYEEASDVYWQSGLVYCENPADETYENLAVYVPGKYMSGTKNADGTYTCEVNPDGTVGGYTAETAPMVLPVDTPGYAAMAAPTGYVSQTSAYTDAGFVYIYAGCRGREAGAPAGVTDLKAAIRYIRYNKDRIPGCTERIFSFGMSGGGAQSALLGATGDSELYTPYLEAIGAVGGVSDAVMGAMCWCPITNLDYANEAYEWNLGVTRENLSEDMRELSDAMAEQFALYINELGLQDENGDALLLTASEEGIYQAGSYYDYLKNVVETSLNNFLEDTTFPYTVSGGGRGGDFGRDFGGDGGVQEFEERGGDFDKFDGEKELRGPGGKDGLDFDGELADEKFPEQGGYYEMDGIDRNETSGGILMSGTYETAEDYIRALNQQAEWVIYDSETNTASITNLADFVSALKRASKDLGAFDALDESQGENVLFGDGEGKGEHFDAVMAKLLENTDYGDEFADDMLRTDALGTSVTERMNMYTPLYYLNDYYAGYATAQVAPYWRIRTGINQSDTALSTEVNLALALKNYGVAVDFETVWGQAHVEAERTGDSTSNFIAWVIECCP